eukprot:c17338_g1_i3.p1 GENE.c17338_g1_i3~~c17338_g1_i3.p1  ORF type:complete len:120 (+),score=20.88 c17338_g1_i3:3-362(+)
MGEKTKTTFLNYFFFKMLVSSKNIFLLSFLIKLVLSGWLDGDKQEIVSNFPWRNEGIYTVWLFAIQLAISLLVILMTWYLSFSDKKAQKSRVRTATVTTRSTKTQEMSEVNNNNTNTAH